jgi:hypothetical protein
VLEVAPGTDGELQMEPVLRACWALQAQPSEPGREGSRI